MLFGAGNISIKFGNREYRFYGPIVFSNATANDKSSYYTSGYWSTHNTSQGQQSYYTPGYTTYTISGSITINNESFALAYSNTDDFNNYLKPTIIFEGLNVIAIKISDNITFSKIS